MASASRNNGKNWDTSFYEWVQGLDENADENNKVIKETKIFDHIETGMMQWDSSLLSSIEIAKGFFGRYVKDGYLVRVATWAHDESLRQKERRVFEASKGDSMRAAGSSYDVSDDFTNLSLEGYVDEIIKWLQRKKGNNESIQVRCQNPDGPEDEMKFTGREITIEAVLAQARKILNNQSSMKETPRPEITILGAAPGVGKTRLLRELIAHLESDAPLQEARSWFLPILLSYNDGNRARERAELYGTQEQRQNTFALRVLFQAVEPVIEKFDAFVERFRNENQTFATSVTLHTSLSVLKKIMDTNSSESASPQRKRGFIYLAIDEFNLLLREESHTVKDKTPLQDVLTQVAKAMQSEDRELLIFPVLAGTTGKAVESVLRNSHYGFKKMPLGLFEQSHIEDIAFDYAKSHHWPSDWFSTKVRKLLADYGRHARSAEQLLLTLNERLEDAENAHNAEEIHTDSTLAQDIGHIEHKMASGGTPSQCIAILSHGISGIPVHRTKHVDSSGDQRTYGDLEQNGTIILSGRGVSRVSLTFPIVSTLLSLIKDHDVYLYKATSTLQSFLRDGPMHWERFEDVMVSYNAVREMCFYRAGKQEATLDEFYPNARGRENVRQRHFFMRENIKVRTCEAQWPPQRKWGFICASKTFKTKPLGELITESNIMEYSLKSCPGGKTDAFHQAARFPDGPLHIWGEQFFLRTTLTLSVLHSEVKKVRDSFRKFGKFQGQLTLLVFAIKVDESISEADDENLPENCLILYGPALFEFCGSAFSFRILEQALGPKEYPEKIGADDVGHQVLINGDPYSTLQKVPGICSIKAENIVKNRPFQNWDDLQQRIPQGVGVEAKQYLCFRPQHADVE